VERRRICRELYWIVPGGRRWICVKKRVKNGKLLEKIFPKMHCVKEKYFLNGS